MTCKDCIHFGICRVERQPAPLSDIYTYECDCIERYCADFKDRSRFVELPIKPSEKVFYFDTEGRIYETTVTQLVYGASGFLIDSDVMFNSNLIGKRFFLTREAAEQALKERKT